MKKLFYIIFKILFGLSLIGLGMRTLSEINRMEPVVNQTIDQIQHKLLKKTFNIANLKEHTNYIVFAEAYLLLACGLLTLFGFTGTISAFLAVFIDLTMVHNVYFYREPKHLLIASGFLALLGGVMNK